MPSWVNAIRIWALANPAPTAPTALTAGNIYNAENHGAETPDVYYLAKSAIAAGVSPPGTGWAILSSLTPVAWYGIGAIAVWNAYTIFMAGAYVTSPLSATFQAIINSLGQDPDTVPGAWAAVTNIWNIGDYVSYSGTDYLCLTADDGSTTPGTDSSVWLAVTPVTPGTPTVYNVKDAYATNAVVTVLRPMFTFDPQGQDTPPDAGAVCAPGQVVYGSAPVIPYLSLSPAAPGTGATYYCVVTTVYNGTTFAPNLGLGTLGIGTSVPFSFNYGSLAQTVASNEVMATSDDILGSYLLVTFTYVNPPDSPYAGPGTYLGLLPDTLLYASTTPGGPYGLVDTTGGVLSIDMTVNPPTSSMAYFVVPPGVDSLTIVLQGHGGSGAPGESVPDLTAALGAGVVYGTPPIADSVYSGGGGGGGPGVSYGVRKVVPGQIIPIQLGNNGQPTTCLDMSAGAGADASGAGGGAGGTASGDLAYPGGNGGNGCVGLDGPGGPYPGGYPGLGAPGGGTAAYQTPPYNWVDGPNATYSGVNGLIAASFLYTFFGSGPAGDPLGGCGGGVIALNYSIGNPFVSTVGAAIFNASQSPPPAYTPSVPGQIGTASSCTITWGCCCSTQTISPGSAVSLATYSALGPSIGPMSQSASSVMVTGDFAPSPMLATDLPSGLTIGGGAIYSVGGTPVAPMDGGFGLNTSSAPAGTAPTATGSGGFVMETPFQVAYATARARV